MEGLVVVVFVLLVWLLVLFVSVVELVWIVVLCDVGDDVLCYLQQLQVVLQQGGMFNESQEWYLFEVVECGVSQLQLGYECEFVICVLLWLQVLVQGCVSILDFILYLDDCVMDIEVLFDVLCDVVFDVFIVVGY